MLGLAKGEGCRSPTNHITIAEILKIQKKVLKTKATSEVCAHFCYFSLIVCCLVLFVDFIVFLHGMQMHKDRGKVKCSS